MSSAVPAPAEAQRPGALRAIAVYKLVEAALLLVAGLGLLRLLGRDIGETATAWVQQLHLDPDRAFIHTALARVTGISQRTLAELGVGSLCYAALRLIEGVGLWLERRWAEYLTIVATGALVPLEIYELARHLSAVRLLVLAINLALVAYLVYAVRLRGRSIITDSHR